MKRRFSASVKIGVDTGGTFTDLVVVERGGALTVVKVPSTPEDPSRAVLSALEGLGLLKGSTPLIHGTTVATNAFLQGRGGRTVLITTRGFEDVLVLGRQARPQLYRLDPPARKEWIPAGRRLGIEERIAASGEVRLPLSRGSMERTLRRIRRLRPDAVAICLLHAYADPAHEKRMAAALRRSRCHVSESHRVAGEFREFERTCTTVANAKLAKPVDGYLAALQRTLGSRRLRIMASSGGWMTASRARSLPVRTLLSGPAGGVGAASLLGKLVACPELITLDMGGTSTDLALCLGEVPRVPRTLLDGVPLLIPTLDIRSLGAGGGSIARRDAGGALRVGPASAGAEPGPACYARGGKEPTLTDAHLALGRLPEEGLLGGKLPLSLEHARAALARLGRSLGMGVPETARGILRVVESSLENSIRSLAAGKGLVPGSLALLVFGGAGGLHACALARRLGIERILVPPDPGAFSALGLASSAATWEASRTILRRVRRLTPAQSDALTSSLEEEGKRAMVREGHPAASLRVVREADARYVGQSHELNLPLGPGFTRRFHEAHRREFGYARREEEVEVVTVRVRIASGAPRLTLRKAPRVRRPAAPAGVQRCWLETGPARTIPIYDRKLLPGGISLNGPALIREYSATAYVAPGFRCKVGAFGELSLTRARG